MLKKLLAAAAATLLMAGAALADPIEGYWQTEPDDGAFAFVEVVPCGDTYCGTIVRTFNADGEYESPNLGKMLLIEMAPQGGGEYKGNVWRPSNDKIYIGKVTIEGDVMKMRGCIAGGLLCSSQTWVRLQ